MKPRFSLLICVLAGTITGVACLLAGASPALARWSYRGLGTTSSFVSSTRAPSYRVTIQSIQANRSIEQSKLKASVQNKLPQIETCYRQISWLRIWKRYHLWKTGNMPKREAQTPPKKDEDTRKLEIALTLNAHGRAVQTQVHGGEMPMFFQNCFVWYLQGRKFFPAEGHKRVSVRLRLEVRMLPANTQVPEVSSSVSTKPARSRSATEMRKEEIRKRLQFMRKYMLKRQRQQRR